MPVLFENNIQSKCSHEAWCVEFAQIEETILSQIIVEQLLGDLNKLNGSIERSIRTYRPVLTEMYPQLYVQKKELISKHMNWQDETEHHTVVRLYYIIVNLYSQIK